MPALRPVLALLALAGCAAPQYRNVNNPAAGKAQYDADNDQCRRENSHATTFVGTYAEVAGTKVDEDKAQARMAARGWRPAS